ncbi:YraN family protein [Oceanibaculum nanhaiense]|jgi:putative endonuclease|uniref:YraN family protein n=1 Tax=Oceanibaculum nanhaiense TaxID=1909734 RepID=UPI000A3C04AD|nr:YraN family protein [Oceanibaculum nanhaiense]MDM7945752.1 YraN family protein [Oceanibaculum nanhaiense]
MKRRSRQERQRARRRGIAAETLCLWLLRLKGYRILARDLRTPVGEIDIVARRGRTLVAVEVKRRGRLEDAAEAIGRDQRRRILRALGWFAQRQPDGDRLSLRFDAMLLDGGLLPRHIRDAWREGV